MAWLGGILLEWRLVWELQGWGGKANYVTDKQKPAKKQYVEEKEMLLDRLREGMRTRMSVGSGNRREHHAMCTHLLKWMLDEGCGSKLNFSVNNTPLRLHS